MTDLRRRIGAIYAFLFVATAASWMAALVVFRNQPALIGMATLAYGLGLRHAVDADHIAAIDNVTRLLIYRERQPAGVGFFFALGHSTIVLLASLGIVLARSRWAHLSALFAPIGNIAGTTISACFLLIIALLNIGVFYRAAMAWKRRRDSVSDLARTTQSPLGRRLRPLYNLIRHSWQMYPIGFLFGLGFDTATEIGVLGVSAAEAAQGLPLGSILLFPLLFTCAMALVDTTDGVLMLGLYRAPALSPSDRLAYNLSATGLSVLLAVVIGSGEALGLIKDHWKLGGAFWSSVAAMGDRLAVLGYGAIALFILCWTLFLCRAVYGRAHSQRPIG